MHTTMVLRSAAMVIVASLLYGCGLMFTSGAEDIERNYSDIIPYGNARILWRYRIFCEKEHSGISQNHGGCEAFEHEMRSRIDGCNNSKQHGWKTIDCEVVDIYNNLFKNLPDGSPDPPVPPRAPSR